MLVLSRKVGEIITVGNSITITVVGNERGIIRLGIDAPRDIPVHRKEVYDKIIEMNRQAAQTKVSALKQAISGLDLLSTSADTPLHTDKLELINQASLDKKRIQ